MWLSEIQFPPGHQGLTTVWGTRGFTLPLSLWNDSHSTCKQASVSPVNMAQKECGESIVLLCLAPLSCPGLP